MGSVSLGVPPFKKKRDVCLLVVCEGHTGGGEETLCVEDGGVGSRGPGNARKEKRKTDLHRLISRYTPADLEIHTG